jgi:hypothetical protein
VAKANVRQHALRRDRHVDDEPSHYDRSEIDLPERATGAGARSQTGRQVLAAAARSSPPCSSAATATFGVDRMHMIEHEVDIVGA